MGRFHAVYDKLSQALDDMPYNELGISIEVREQVILIPFPFNFSLICFSHLQILLKQSRKRFVA